MCISIKRRKIIKALLVPFLVIAIVVALWIGTGVGVLYYNYHLSPPARLRNQVKLGQGYQAVYELFSQYREKYKNNPNVSMGEGTTDKRVADALKITQGRRLSLWHSILFDDLELIVYFDDADKVTHIEYVGD